jgi:hypothetical protein
MKVRQGFVSNSSTSSFIVKVNDDLNLAKGFKPLSKKKVDLLKKHGFYECMCPSPELLDGKETETKRIKVFKSDREQSYLKAKKKCPKYKIQYLGYRVICNQDFALDFLVYNDIPFVASVHYGHYTYVYKEGGQYIYILNNFGLQEDDDPEKFFKNKKDMKAEGIIAYKESKKEWLKDYNPEESEQYMDSTPYLGECDD